jgi:hypothetical protein
MGDGLVPKQMKHTPSSADIIAKGNASFISALVGNNHVCSSFKLGA